MKQLDQYRLDCAQKQKRGLHFILASVVIWCAMTVIYFSGLPILTKNLFAFICTGMLLPLSFLISKIINVDFQNKDNPLSNLGLLFSLNQLLYLLRSVDHTSELQSRFDLVCCLLFEI